jgi:ATP-dependent Clp protease adapter protein ClpS
MTSQPQTLSRPPPRNYGVLIQCGPACEPKALHFVAGLFLGTFGLDVPDTTDAVRRIENGEFVIIGGWSKDIAESKASQIMKRAESAEIDVHVECCPIET